ncbi:MAG: hypothetical protein U9R69_02615 [Thermodesulfobacteriota bacterium]|nr:hypothetical protein [Thermodesulfobacteriota bacterium]
MAAKKISGTLLILLGITVLGVGICQYNKSRTPNTCIVSFAKSLGGKASMELENSIQRARGYGIAGISGGVVLALAGGVLLLKSGKKRF